MEIKKSDISGITYVDLQGQANYLNWTPSVEKKWRFAKYIPITDYTLGTFAQFLTQTQYYSIHNDYFEYFSRRSYNPLELEIGSELELRDYQKEMVKKGLSMTSYLNFSQPRTGKTPTTLVQMKNLKKKFIFVCPPSVVLASIVPQIEKWLGIPILTMFEKKTNKNGILYYSPLSKAQRMGIYKQFGDATQFIALVISKDTLKDDVLSEEENCLSHFSLRTFNMVVDEAHFLKQYKTPTKCSKQSKAVMELGKKADFRVAMTGTPSANHPSEIWPILHFAWPQRFKSFYEFENHYWGQDRFGGTEKHFRKWQLENEFTEIVDKMSGRVLQKDVMQWLPEIVREKVYLDADKVQAEQLGNTMLHFENENGFIQNALTQAIEIRKISNGITIDGKWYSKKAEWLIEYIQNHPEENIMILSNFSRETFDPLSQYLSKNGIEYSIIRGDVSMNGRLDIQNTVNLSLESGRIILANITAVKEGINLEGIDTEIFFDRNYRPDYNEQVEQRFTPTTIELVRKKPKVVIDLILKNPIDIASLDEKKARKIQRILSDEKVIELLERKIDINRYIQEISE